MFSMCFSTVCLQHGSKRISTHKVPHELTSSLGTALQDQQTSPFHLKNKLSSFHFRTFVINSFCLDFISTEILKAQLSSMTLFSSTVLHVLIYHCFIQTTHHLTRNYGKPWLTNSKTSTPSKPPESSDYQGSSAEVQ